MSANNKDLPLKSVWIQSSNFKILNISETGEGGGGTRIYSDHKNKSITK